jgi:hypothetical protein
LNDAGLPRFPATLPDASPNQVIGSTDIENLPPGDEMTLIASNPMDPLLCLPHSFDLYQDLRRQGSALFL